MGWFSDDSDEAQSFNQLQNSNNDDSNKPTLSHEVIGGAAAYEAMKAYDDHVAKNGQPASHSAAKEIAASLAGAFIDREVESRGMNFFDKEKAKHEAKKRLNQQIDDQGY